MIIKAYKPNIVGRVCAGLYILQTFGMIGYMITIVYDYYQNYLMFRGYSEVQTCTFIGMWYIFFFWFASLTIFKKRLSNFFRIQCRYSEGEYVQIEKEEPGKQRKPLQQKGLHLALHTHRTFLAVIFLEDQSNRIMDLVRWLESTAKHVVGLDVVVTTAPLQRTRTGTKYFIYQCTRYVYNPQTQLFTPHSFDMGETIAALASQTGGLTTEDAILREELVGPNFISVHVPNFVMAMLREFSSFFYTYQFTCMWLFYYLSYCESS